MDAILGGIIGAGITAAGAIVVALVQHGRAAARTEVPAPRETALPPAPPSSPIRTHADATLEAIAGRVTALEENDRRAARIVGRLEIQLARLEGQGGHSGRDSDG